MVPCPKRRPSRWPSATNLGLLLEKSPDELAFRHRQFQEHLAARYLHAIDPEQAREVLRTYAAELPWNQVLLGFFALIPARRNQEFTICLVALTYEGALLSRQYYLGFLRYDICLRLPNASLPLALAQDEAVRQPLLRLLLAAAENPGSRLR